MNTSLSALASLSALTDAALARAEQLGAVAACARIDSVRRAGLRLRDGLADGGADSTRTGLSVRVRTGGAWGFAATGELSPAAAAGAADRAAAMARYCAGFGADRGEPVPEPGHGAVSWVSAYRTNPFDVPAADRAALLASWSRRLLAAPQVAHVLASLSLVQEDKFYADLAGTRASQRRIWVHPMLLVAGHDPASGSTATVRSTGPPAARGWEYLLGDGWDWDAELAELPGLLAGQLRALPVRPGRYDLVIDPSNLWLTIHECVGHATEADRALGDEAGYAGTSFATPDGLGELRVGSELMNVTADRTTRHGLASIGYDDEGVLAQSWPLVTGGVLAGFQTDRQTAAVLGEPRSRGCAYAESGLAPPLARMPNVSLAPDPAGPDLDGLIGGVADGIYLAGSGSWSIDLRRRHFQFTAQHCHKITAGRLAGPLRNVAYRGSTPEFWGSLRALGGPASWRLFGADLCGKGQPVQISGASHGCPPAVFENVEVADASGEAGM